MPVTATVRGEESPVSIWDFTTSWCIIINNRRRDEYENVTNDTTHRWRISMPSSCIELIAHLFSSCIQALPILKNLLYSTYTGIFLILEWYDTHVIANLTHETIYFCYFYTNPEYVVTSFIVYLLQVHTRLCHKAAVKLLVDSLTFFTYAPCLGICIAWMRSWYDFLYQHSLFHRCHRQRCCPPPCRIPWNWRWLRWVW